MLGRKIFVVISLLSLFLVVSCGVHDTSAYPASALSTDELPAEFDTLIRSDGLEFATWINGYEQAGGATYIRAGRYYEKVGNAWIYSKDESVCLRGKVIRITRLDR